MQIVDSNFAHTPNMKSNRCSRFILAKSKFIRRNWIRMRFSGASWRSHWTLCLSFFAKMTSSRQTVVHGLANSMAPSTSLQKSIVLIGVARSNKSHLGAVFLVLSISKRQKRVQWKTPPKQSFTPPGVHSVTDVANVAGIVYTRK